MLHKYRSWGINSTTVPMGLSITITLKFVQHVGKMWLLYIVYTSTKQRYTGMLPKFIRDRSYVNQILMITNERDIKLLCRLIIKYFCKYHAQPNSLIHRYGPLAPHLFFFLMGIIGKGKMCRNWICLLTLPKNVPRMFNMQISQPLCEKNVLAIYHLNSEIHE